MAIWYGSALGRGKNKFGNAVLAKWKGLNVFKIYNPEVANPNTQKQQMVRARFGALAMMCRPFRAAISLGFRRLSNTLNSTEYGVFISKNYSKVVATGPDDIIIGYSDLMVSEGALPEVTFGTPDYGSTEHLTIEVPFDGNVGQEGSDATDEVYVLAYAKEINQGMLSSAGLRSGSSVAVSVPSAWSGLDVYLYGFAIGRGAENQGEPSMSKFIGHAEVQ